MIAVVPLGRSRPTTLPYVLRSLHYAGVTELVTVGQRPDGIEPDRHIESPNDAKPHLNVAGHLRKAADLFDEFIWLDDDTVFLADWTPGVYVRPFSIAHMLRSNPTRGSWSKAVRAAIGVMAGWGYDPETVPCGTVHRPWLVHADRVRKTLDGLDEVGGGSFKALYVAGLEGTVPADDPKVWGHGFPDADADMVSFEAGSWRYNAGRVVRERFGEPSRWETEPLPDVRRGPRRHRR